MDLFKRDQGQNTAPQLSPNDLETYKQVNQAYTMAQMASHEADLELDEAQTWGHAYIIAKREENFQEEEEKLQRLCNAFESMKAAFLNQKKVRPHVVSDAFDNYVDACNEYLNHMDDSHDDITREEIGSELALAAGDPNDIDPEDLDIRELDRDTFEDMMRNNF